jgi:class 3 adenylate cyclase
MWLLTISAPEQEPKRIELMTGKLSIGRSSSNDVVIDDSSASRQHAEILVDEATKQVIIIDLNSTNGTYVNRQRIQGSSSPLSENDVIRIGQVVFHLINDKDKAGPAVKSAVGTHLFTRDLLLEAVDEHSILMYEVSRKLNTVLDVNTALHEVTALLKNAMGVDSCEVLLARQIEEMKTAQFVHPEAKKAIQNKAAEVTAMAMFVPILSGEHLIGLICMYKGRPQTRPFEQRDLQLAVAVSHQAALTLQRMELLTKVRRQEQIHQLLERFVSPLEAEFMLKDYFKSGKLPGLTEQKVTILFSDIANSTGLAEHLGSTNFASILNKYYQNATDIIFKYGGIVKYLGDGILSIFMEHDTGLPAEEKAILAGRELIQITNRTGSLAPNRRIVIGVAINTGKAMAGYVGTQERVEFVVLGDTVNVAYRMQEYARPYKIIVGPATVAAISGKYKFLRVGAVTIKGREQSIQAYQVLP